MTLLIWLTFLFGSQTVILTVLLFWISFFFLYLFYNGFPSIRKFWYVIVSVSIDFLSNSQRDALFHRIAYDDYSFADWDGLCDHVRDVPCEDIFKLGFLVLLVTCEWVQVGIDVYISVYIRSILTDLHGFQLLALLP